MEGIDGITLGIVTGGMMALIALLGFDSITRLQDLEEESLADKERIQYLTEELSLHKSWLLTIRDKLEIEL